jgi:carboxymethylenebutenolidase
MCNGAALSFFPEPGQVRQFSGPVEAFVQGPDDAPRRIAVLPDIYGCSPFYVGLSAYFALRGSQVFLVDTFAGLGDLAQPTREAAFARRHKVADKKFLDRFEAFSREQRITGVIGFCLGGLYIFELARRGLNAELVGLYGFPQGLPNMDPIPVPFDYIEGLKKPYTMLIGREDASVGPENVRRLEDIAGRNAATNLVVFDGVGHDFMSALGQTSGPASDAARQSLELCEAELLP